MFGFIVDSLTLQRIDALRENLWISANLLVVAICIIILSRSKKSGFWTPNILQFSFGALLGSVFVFYFRSAALAVAWPFMLILLLAILANEFFQKKYERLAFQLAFFYFSLFSFSIFVVPLVAKSIKPEIFLLSGGVSLVVIWLFLLVLRLFAREKFLEERTHIWSLVTVIFAVVNVLYFMNLIPPIPLSMKDAGIYHSLSRNALGDYEVKREPRGFEKYFDLTPEIHWREGETLYAYSAVFSPSSLNTDIVHVWQYKNDAGEWEVVTKTPLYLSGGRGGGFRTFSSKNNFLPGLWRVDIETPRGQIIGRINFKIVRSGVIPPLESVVKK